MLRLLKHYFIITIPAYFLLITYSEIKNFIPKLGFVSIFRDIFSELTQEKGKIHYLQKLLN